ncbi:nuclease-related domain-containing protein [Oceanobacillus halotolerans]|uniref:nuclease-related domain-containing protein n=1 Tax=Oceanobacillus halotolerans TaxID=2663380 RepID=UPI0013D97356|nr:nuclease-related domain-containing protein [Oceanobacillus halotolerans]
MLSLLSLFKQKDMQKQEGKHESAQSFNQQNQSKTVKQRGGSSNNKLSVQLEQISKDYHYLSDILIENPKSVTGFSHMDHLVLTPYGIFVIDVKDYKGNLFGTKKERTWTINGKINVMNPFVQVDNHIQALKNVLSVNEENPFISLVCFSNRCKLKIDEALREVSCNEVAIYEGNLEETINRKIHIARVKQEQQTLTQNDLTTIYKTVVRANITDPAIRQKHNDSIDTA